MPYAYRQLVTLARWAKLWADVDFGHVDRLVLWILGVESLGGCGK